MRSTIVYEDSDLLVVDKPAGLVVHPAAGHADGTLVNALLHHCAGQLSGIGGVARPGHRPPDRQGYIGVAGGRQDRCRASGAGGAVRRAFDQPALCRDRAGAAHARQWHGDAAISAAATTIARKWRWWGKGAASTPSRTSPAEEKLRGATRVECRLETGRTHQVRVHMASIGHALLGDPLYSKPPKALRDLLKAADFQPSGIARTAAGVYTSGDWI